MADKTEGGEVNLLIDIIGIAALAVVLVVALNTQVRKPWR
jgi:hypothetical protein